MWMAARYNLGPSFGLDFDGGPCLRGPRPSRSFHKDSVTWRAWVSSIQSAQSAALSNRRRAVDPLAGSLCRLASLDRCDAGVIVATQPIRDP